MIRDIIQAPDAHLLKPSIPVRVAEDGDFPVDVYRVMKDLMDTRARGEGPGLAAVQIVEHINIVAVDPEIFYGFTVLVNPDITRRGKEVVTEFEGCMSIGRGQPRFLVRRHRVVTVKFLDHNGVERMTLAKGLPARLVQHELDHLQGKLIA